jgi:hypothetical protein
MAVFMFAEGGYEFKESGAYMQPSDEGYPDTEPVWLLTMNLTRIY